MAIQFPLALDTLTNPTATDAQSSPSHSTQHANANDAIEALEAKVGIDNSVVTSSIDYRLGQLEAERVRAISTKTGNYTLTTADEVVLCDASGGAFTITLPPAASATRYAFTVVKIDDSDNFVTVQANSTETISGRNTQILPGEWGGLRCVSNGTAWFLIP